jgi:hypothetical protein
MSLIITFLVTSFLCLVDMLVTWNIYKRFWGCRPNKTSLLPPLGLLIEETYPEIMVCMSTDFRCIVLQGNPHCISGWLPYPVQSRWGTEIWFPQWNQQHSKFVFMRGSVIAVQFIKGFLLLGIPLH